ncbi:MAG TPA: sugar-specific transcriptional regulator TrmB [Methanoregulaceae archaeon]|nr:sugar-specific transcriptional regulator TrmB [Methanoregulaceae archaeon]
MQGVIKRRREYLQLMRACTMEKGYFSVTNIQEGAAVPRSTAQDWINRLVDEGCVILKERKQGRIPAKYAAISAMPSSACRKIFTTIDGDRVEIYHECLSGACAAFCGHHHTLAGGVLINVRRDGNLLRECARIGLKEMAIGLHPAPAVGVAGVERDGEDIIQHIRCIGGPAYSLTDMMSHAEGVREVIVSRNGDIVEGKIRSRALTYVVIGLDDTDSSEGGATFALSLALLQYLCTMKGVFPIGHYVAMLYPGIKEKTAGNSCSYIELAVEPELFEKVLDKALLFIGDEALSAEWGMAVKKGFRIPEGLRDYGSRARLGGVSLESAKEVAEQSGISLHGRRGVIGALAAVALSGLPNDILLNPDLPLPGL